MSREEKYEEVCKLADELMDQLLPQLGGLAIDIGKVNDLLMLLDELKDNERKV